RRSRRGCWGGSAAIPCAEACPGIHPEPGAIWAGVGWICPSSAPTSPRRGRLWSTLRRLTKPSRSSTPRARGSSPSAASRCRRRVRVRPRLYAARRCWRRSNVWRKLRMSGRRSRRKGSDAEREFAKLIGGERVPLSGAAGGSYTGDVVGLGLKWECKRRKDGFKQLYSWLEGKDALALRA